MIPTQIEYTDISPKEFVAPLSRYLDATIIRRSTNKQLTFTLYKKKQFTPNKLDKFTVIKPGHEYRPDLTSQSFYGIPDLWWKIMEVNNIKDIIDYKAGKTIRLPANTG